MTTTIKFSKNWNYKLNCKIFTTIRGRYGKYGDKYKYYLDKVGQEIKVLPDGLMSIDAKLIRVTACTFSQIPMSTVETDTGLEYDIARELFEKEFGIKFDSPVILLTIQNNNLGD